MTRKVMKLNLFFATLVILLILVALPGCKKERWCACYCDGNFFDVTYLEYNTEEECKEMAKQHPDCNCEWD